MVTGIGLGQHGVCSVVLCVVCVRVCVHVQMHCKFVSSHCAVQ